MSSPPPFIASSPITPSTTRRRKSAFTYKHLSQLSLSSTTCPLHIIAHIDLDAFYAQCEMVRLGVPTDQPLAVQQWQGLIAINYPARAFGLSRHVTVTEAQKLCPSLITQHVATWKEGDEKWAYHEDAFKNIHTHKVSLDPYRLESRKILATIKEFLPAPPVQRVEKASIDEVFLDLSAQVHGILLERYPELNGPAPYDDPTEPLPRPPTTALDWATDALVDLDDAETEDDDPDWDDIVMQIASEIVRDVRAKIYEKLKYTCSAGISRNKMLAKLGSGHKKPNQQTVIRNRAVQQFLSGFKFTKIRNLGGKLGDEVVAAFNTDTVKELLEVPVDQLKRQLGDDTGSWLYSIIRGEDHSEVNSRTQIKSMLSAKSFRPSINTFEQAVRWLRIFVADIYSRLVEEGVLENKRRPKTINLHHRQGAQTRSKQAPIPMGKAISEELLFDAAKNLLAQVVVDGRAWPCANLSLSVGGFEDGITGNKGIGGFLVRGEEAKAMNSTVNRETGGDNMVDTPPPGKRRKVEEGGITRFFGMRQESTGATDREEEGMESPYQTDAQEGVEQDAFEPPPSAQRGDMGKQKAVSEEEEEEEEEEKNEEDEHERYRDAAPTHALQQASIEQYFCARCNKSLPEYERSEHDDWHFAKDLLEEERQASTPVPPRPPSKPPAQHKGKGRGRPAGGTLGRAEKGQRKLAFG
ncbi:DNA-directed DNA polymerase eta rad30 [Zalaria obscura]|uniref:DNA-directed DNA polymerase eta rad30 n=1 Tax=Zalaria obscura TaxID=2024903 RepID=A0ACC3SNY8_9PEZI